MEDGKEFKDALSLVAFYQQTEKFKEEKIKNNPALSEDDLSKMISSQFFIKKVINTAPPSMDYRPEEVYFDFKDTNDEIFFDYCLNNAGADITLYQHTPKNNQLLQQATNKIDMSKEEQVTFDKDLNYYYEVTNFERGTKILVGLRSEEEAKEFYQVMEKGINGDFKKTYDVKPVVSNLEKKKLMLEVPSILNLDPKRAIDEIKKATHEGLVHWQNSKKFAMYKYFSITNSKDETAYFAVPFHKSDPRKAGADYRDLVCAKLNKELIGDNFTTHFKVNMVRASDPKLQDSFFKGKAIEYLPVSIGPVFAKNVTETLLTAVRDKDTIESRNFLYNFEKDIESSPYMRKKKAEQNRVVGGENTPKRPNDYSSLGHTPKPKYMGM